MGSQPALRTRHALARQAAERKLPPWAADIDVASWAQYFLKYVISHPAVTCAIAGSTRLSHLVDNQAAGRGRLPDAALRRRMEEYWDASAGEARLLDGPARVVSGCSVLLVA